jgi:hypothetical protein
MEGQGEGVMRREPIVTFTISGRHRPLLSNLKDRACRIERALAGCAIDWFTAAASNLSYFEGKPRRMKIRGIEKFVGIGPLLPMAEISSQKDVTGPACNSLSGNRAAAIPGRLAGLIGMVVVGLAAIALCAPFMRSIFWLADEGVLLNGAERMLRGNRLYVDFFEFLPPGGFVVTAAWFWIAGISLLSARILTTLIITGIACFTYLACRAACKQAFYPVLVVVAWLVMTQGFLTQLSHHWLTTLFSMIVLWSALNNLGQPPPRLREPLIAGLAAGWAVMTVETCGALVILTGIIAFALPRSKSQLTAFTVASAVAPIGLFAYIVAERALRAAVDDVIVFAATQYTSIQWAPFGYLANVQTAPLIFVFPLAAFLVLLCCIRDWPGCLRNRQFIACIVFALAGFIGCYPRPDASHIGFAVPLACPLITCCAKDLTQGRLQNFRSFVVAVGIVLCFPSSLAYWVTSQGALNDPIVPTARGDVRFFSKGSGASALAAEIAHTPKAEAYFFYPFMPVMSFLTARGQVSKYEIFTPDYTSPSQYREACIAVMRHASWVVIDRQWTNPHHIKWIFPAMGNPAPRETRMFERALESRFALVARYREFELRHRTQAANQIACAGIIR